MFQFLVRIAAFEKFSEFELSSMQSLYSIDMKQN